jgi:hypothetical protein
MITTLAGFELSTDAHGRDEVRPVPPLPVLRELVSLCSRTFWPMRTTTDRLPQLVDLFDDLAYAHVARGMALLALLAQGAEPAPEVLTALRHSPSIKEEEGGQDGPEYVWLTPAELLADTVAPQCPAPIRELVRGRITTGLRDWPANTAQVCAGLAAASGPDPVEGESAGNRAYGAHVAAALYGTFLGVPALRWPLAAAWATHTLAHEWLHWADTVPAAARATTVGLAPYGGTSLPAVAAPRPDWADIVG